MNRKNHLLIALLFILCRAAGLSAQPIYNMSNMTVDDCEGFLLDSDAGDNGSEYNHNENLTFSICVPGADRIDLSFQTFCLEEFYDSLRVYDGPDTLSTLLGVFLGEEDPPALFATSGCLTVNFVSDPNVACHGWVAHWTTEFDIPDPPDILPIANLPCESNTLTLTFAEPVPCDSLYPQAFAISGPQSPNVLSATPLDCAAGQATSVQLTYEPPIDFSGNYRVQFTQVVWACEIPYVVTASENFAVVDCPLNVALQVEETEVCAGDSLFLWAEISGGDPNSYAISWSPVEGGAPELATVAPDSAVTYVVVVTDGNGATASDSIAIHPFPLPVLSMGDTSLCQSEPPFVLEAVPAGGAWSGAGFASGEAADGLYDPSLIEGDADVITYEDPNGCSTQIEVAIIPLDIGTVDASCPGPAAGPFPVSGGLPEGGAWSGTFISPDGVFTPPAEEGSYEVTYTHPNGCSATKVVNVGNITLPPLDSVCQSEAPFEIAITPFGGVWEGPGIADADFGLFDPGAAGPGAHDLYYQINGCGDTLSLYVKEIDAGSAFTACPAQEAFQLPGNWGPPEGRWSGTGVIDPIGGWYDPSLVPSGSTDTLTFAANGCTDTRLVYVQQTQIRMPDTVSFCRLDDPLVLNARNTGIRPENGAWSGPGVQYDGAAEEWIFDPGQPPLGAFTWYYEANTCVDSVKIILSPNPVVEPLSLCVADAAATLSADLPDGQWSGPGITDAYAGTFDPSVAGAGRHTVFYESIDGCFGEGAVEVVEYMEAALTSIEPLYCYRDTNLVLGQPAGGILMVDSLVVDSFNPAAAGPGPHTVHYTVGSGSCADSVSFPITVGEPIVLDLPFESDSICFRQNVTLRAEATGGSSNNNFTYHWDQGLGFGQNHYVTPEATTTYTVQVEDGCSDPATGSVLLYVHRPIYLDYTTGPQVCADDTTFATVAAFPGNAGEYAFTWNTDPPTEGPTLEAHPLTYLVTVTDTLSGCQERADIRLPGWPVVEARFGMAPAGECMSIFDSELQILDFSVGGVTGYWDFGDGSGERTYELGAPVYHTFADTGVYQIRLHLENEGGCTSEYQALACVLEEHRLYTPTAFSPNGDQVNDEYQLYGKGIAEIEWEVYDRYGGILFRGFSIDDRWDGRARGQLVNSGVYLLVAKYRTDYGLTRTVRGEITVMR